MNRDEFTEYLRQLNEINSAFEKVEDSLERQVEIILGIERERAAFVQKYDIMLESLLKKYPNGANIEMDGLEMVIYPFQDGSGKMHLRFRLVGGQEEIDGGNFRRQEDVKVSTKTGKRVPPWIQKWLEGDDEGLKKMSLKGRAASMRSQKGHKVTIEKPVLDMINQDSIVEPQEKTEAEYEKEIHRRMYPVFEP
jgi:hypothetical protein